MKKLTLALLSGGISSERDVSIASGNQVNEALDREKYNVIRYDPKTDLPRLIEEASKIDAALIILHGPYGEDGTVQGLLDLLDIPYQGSGVIGSALGMNKLASKKLYEKSGLLVPTYTVVKQADILDIDEITKRFGLPLVVKPVSSGSSVGITIVKSADSIKDAVDNAFLEDDEVLIEAYIQGIELTGGVIGNDNLEALPIIEIIPGETLRRKLTWKQNVYDTAATFSSMKTNPGRYKLRARFLGNDLLKINQVSKWINILET